MEQTEHTVHNIKSSRKWRSGHWRAIAGLMTMVAALAVVWALLASLTAWQREKDLEKATNELNDLRETIQILERRDSSVDETQPVPLPDRVDEEENRDLIESMEEELGISTSAE
jgi:hypothetical protein